MVQLIDGYDFQGIGPKVLMGATYKAATNFQLVAIYEAKEEIIKTGKYNEKEFFQLYDALLDAETERKIVLEELRGWEPLSLREIAERIVKFPPENVIKDVIYLKEQGYVEEIIETKTRTIKQKIKGEEKEVEVKDYYYRYKAKDLTTDFIENHFEPVSVVFEAGVCCNCGWCSSVCPLNAIAVDADNLEIDKEACIKCGLCFSVCPRSFSIDQLFLNIKKLTNTIKWSDKIGPYLSTYSGTTTDEKIKEVRQDGGIVTSLLHHLLENQLVDGIVAVQHSKDYWKPEPIIVDNIDDLYKTGGTKYANSPSLNIIQKTKSHQKLAFVGVPCMMKALEKGKMFPSLFPFFKNIEYRIGLFCMESFPYEGIKKLVNEQFDKDIHDVIKMNIGGGKFIISLKSGEQLNVPLKDVQKYARDTCHFCEDLTSDYADISVGSIGSQDGWSSIITRTEKGEELVKAAIKAEIIDVKNLTEVKPGQFLVEKIAGIKRNKCKPIVLKTK